MFDSVSKALAAVGGSGPREDVPLLTSAWNGQAPVTAPPRDTTALRELRESRVRMRNAALAESNAQLDQALACAREPEAPAAQRALGAWNVAKTVFMKGVNKVALETTRGLDNAAQSINTSGFKSAFPELVASGATLIDTFQVHALHGGVGITGTLYVSTTHLAFYNGGRISTSLPFKEVVSLVECIAAETYDHGRPYLIPKPEAAVRSDSMQVFLSDHRLAEFCWIAPSNSDLAAEATNSAVKSAQAAAMCFASAYDAWAKFNGGHSIVEDCVS